MSEGQVLEGSVDNTEAVEKEARAGGWVPKEEFRDGDHWVDAETFVRRGKEINPILRKNNENLLKQLEAAKGEIAEVKKVAKEFEAFQKENAAIKVKQLEAELKDLKEQKKTAITQGDGEAVVALDEAIDAVKDQQREAKVVPKEEKKVEPAAALDPVLVDWMNENKWFTEDQKYTKIADAIGVDINQRFPQLVGKAFLAKLDEELAEVLPERLKKTQRSSPVEGSTSTNTSRPASKSKQTYENLPADAKQACDRFVKQGFVKSREAYCLDYDWS